MTSEKRHFLDIAACDSALLHRILAQAIERKQARQELVRKGEVFASTPDTDAPLKGCLLAMVFEKPSTRTRVSFEVAICQMGGESLVLFAEDMQMKRGESPEDTARILSLYVDAIMLRTLDARQLHRMLEAASVPVINGLTDLTHPCQIMADMMTLQESKGDLSALRIAWLGDGNNITNSYIEAAARFGFILALSCPSGLAPEESLIRQMVAEGAKIEMYDRPEEAVVMADCVVTDCWLSMNDDGKELNHRHDLLRPYQVNERMMALAKEDAVFLHCLPAHRGEEVTDAVIDGPQSLVLAAAENRLHVQKSILHWCIKG